jgi:hypothetical protein
MWTRELPSSTTSKIKNYLRTKVSRREKIDVSQRGNIYILVGDKLYRWATTSGVLMKDIISPKEDKDVSEEIHKIICHAS